MNKTIEYRELTVDVPNPLRDRRKRYGIESVDMFPKGTRFGLSLWEDGTNNIYFDARFVSSNSRELNKTLIANSTLATPRNAREVVFARDPWSSGITQTLAELLQILVEQGKVTLADVEAADVERDRRYREDEERVERERVEKEGKRV